MRLTLGLSPSLLPSVETVNDGQFHSVELVMLNQTLNLVVDKGAPKSLGKLQKQPAVGINSPLYLGGKAPLPCHPTTSQQPSVLGHLHPTPLAGAPLFSSRHPLAKPIREGFLEVVTTKLLPKGRIVSPGKGRRGWMPSENYRLFRGDGGNVGLEAECRPFNPGRQVTFPVLCHLRGHCEAQLMDLEERV